MKKMIKATLTIVLLVILIPAVAQQAYKVKNNKITIEGTSTMHDWVSEVTKLEWSGSLLIEDNTLKGVDHVTIKIPVKSIQSTKGRMMDSKTYDAFDAEKNPYIIFKLSDSNISGSGGNYTITVNGVLTMAGYKKSIALTVNGKMLSNGDLQFTGNKKLNMTEFKMEPPTAMMGAIKVGEEVTINFDLVLSL